MKRILPIAIVLAFAAVISLSSQVDSTRVAASTEPAAKAALPCGAASNGTPSEGGLMPVPTQVLDKRSLPEVDAASGGSHWMN